jgi:hypothetical protein
MSMYDLRCAVHERKKQCFAKKTLREKQLCTLVRRSNSEIFGIAARINVIAS